MALFGSKKKTEKTIEMAAAKAAPAQVSAAAFAAILSNPRITEKAAMHAQDGVYVFDVADKATKRQIIAAVERIYKVHPRAVNIVRVPTKRVRSMRTGRTGYRGGGKKAYVYLKKGETITIA